MLTRVQALCIQWRSHNVFGNIDSQLRLQAQTSCIDEYAFWRNIHLLHATCRFRHPETVESMVLDHLLHHPSVSWSSHYHGRECLINI